MILMQEKNLLQTFDKKINKGESFNENIEKNRGKPLK
jgi:hypothetical protein